MRIRAGLIVSVAVAVGAFGVAASAMRISSAGAELSSANSLLESTKGQVRQITDLRSRQARIADRKRPEQDVIARVHAAMAEAGLDVAGHFAALRPEADSPLPQQPQYRRQSVVVSLQRMDLARLGAFLAAWRGENSLWTASRLELVHNRGKGSEGTYDVTVTFSAVYLAEPTPPPSSTSTAHS